MTESRDHGARNGARSGPAPETQQPPSAGHQPSPQTSPRRAYSAPRLQSLGRLSRFTRFGGSEIVDSGSGLGQQL